MSFIYFVSHQNAQGFIKIGRTTDLTRRMSRIATYAPSGLKLHAVMPELGLFTEQTLHEYFKYQCVRGEWFKLEGKLLELLS